MQTQEIKPLLDKLNQPRKMFRINTPSGRLYWCKDETTGEVRTYVSATTFTRSVLPTSPHLIKWIREQGSEYEKVLDLSANYGTMYHAFCSDLVIQGEFDLDKVESMIEPFAFENGFKNWKLDWAEKMKSDLLCWAKFVQDYELEALGVEMVLASDKYGVAGALDYVAYINIEVDGFSETEKFKTGARAGEFKPEKKKKRVLAIIDIKSGYGGSNDDHELQLAIHKEAFLESFPQFKREEIYLFNFHPKDFKKEPTYSLIDQTDSVNLTLLPLLGEVARIQERKKDRTMKIIKGKIDLKRPEKLVENLKYQSLTDYLQTL